MERRFLSVNETAAFCRLHPETVRTMIARGEIKAVRFGRALRIDFRALNEKIESQLREQAELSGSGGERRRP